MGIIKEYNSPNASGGLRLSDKGIGALQDEASTGMRMAAQASASVRREGEDYGSAVKATGQVAQDAYDTYVVQPEISKGAAALAGYQDALTTKWNALAKGTDPNDATIKQKFMNDELEPALQRFNDSFSTAAGKKFAEDQSNSFRKHMFEKTTADVSTRAGEALVSNLNTMKNTLSNAVRNDPSAYDQSAALVRATIKEQVANTPGLSVATAARIEGTLATNMQAELAKATILGVAEKNPDAAQKLIDSGKFNKLIDGTEMTSMVKTMKTASRADAAFARQEKDRAEALVSENASDEYLSKMYSGKPGDIPSVRDIAVDPKLSLKDRKMLIETSLKRAEQSPDAPVVQDNPATVNDFMNRLTDPSQKLTLGDLTKASANKEITDATYNRLNGMRKSVDAEPFQNPAIKSTIDAVETKLTNNNPLLGIKDPKGDTLISQWKLQVFPKLIEMEKAGKLTPADMDLGDPNSFISKSLQPYQRSQSQIMLDLVNVTPSAITNAAKAAPAPAKNYDGSNPPPALKGIAALTYSPSKKLFRDDSTGKLYDQSGNEVK